VRSAGGDLGDDRAYCRTTPAAVRYPREDGTMGAEPSVCVASFHDTHGPVKPGSFRQFAAAARDQGSPLPPLLLDAKRCLPFHVARLSPDEDPDGMDRYAEAVRKVDGAMRAHTASPGLDEDWVDGLYESGSEIVDYDSTFTLRFLFAFWRLCEHRVAAVEDVETNHAAKLAALKTRLSADVRVVRLRQPAARESTGAATHEWQHRCVVRMHKVK